MSGRDYTTATLFCWFSHVEFYTVHAAVRTARDIKPRDLITLALRQHRWLNPVQAVPAGARIVHKSCRLLNTLRTS